MPLKKTKNKRISTKKQELKMLLHQPALLILIILILCTLALFVLYPMLKIIKLSFTNKENAFSFENAAKIFSSRSYRQVLWNSIKLGLVTGFLSTVVGYIFAFSTTRTSMPLKKFFDKLIHLPIISPPFILALSVIFLFGKQGLITKGIFNIKNNNVYGFGSLVLIQVITFFPVAYLTLTGILSSIDSSVEDAALNMGASRWHIFWTVTFPLSFPGVISAFLLTFVQSLEDFSNPAVIGGNYSTLSIEAYKTITGMYDLHGGSMLAITLLLPTVCAFLLQRYYLNKKSFVTVTGKPTQEGQKLGGRANMFFFVFCMVVSAFIILLYGTVLVGAFVETWGVKYNFSMKHFTYAYGFAKEAIGKSLKLALIAAPITGILGIAIAFLTVRKTFPGKKIMQISSLLTFAIPGTVLGIGYISAFNTKPIILTGTGLILVAAFIFRNMSVSIESGASTLLQIDKSIDEASFILGASNGLTFRRITLPLLKQPFFSGIVFSFVRGMTAVSTVIFLTSPRWPLATSKVYSLFEISKYSDAAALVVLMIAVMLIIIGLINVTVNFILKPRARKF